MNHNRKNLKSKWENLLKSDKKIRIRDAAKKLGVSELELLVTKINDEVQYLLINDFHKFFISLFENIKSLMFLIRNDVSVHEKTVNSSDLKISKDGFINCSESRSPFLNIDFNNFIHCFYESKIHAGRRLCSLQIFDYFGDSVIKIYNRDDGINFERICKKNISLYENQVENISKSKIHKNFEYINSVNRYFMNPKLTIREEKISNDFLRKVFDLVSKNNFPIQIHLVGNNCIQYHRDIIKNIKIFGPWFNVMDKNFNLHLMDENIETTKLIEFSKDDKKYFSLEFFDDRSNHLLGITSLENYCKDFAKILNESGVLK